MASTPPPSSSPSSFLGVHLSFQGKVIPVPINDNNTIITAKELYEHAYSALGFYPEETELKLLYKGKRLDPLSSSPHASIELSTKKTPKLLVMATPKRVAKEIANKRSDPTIRGLEQELNTPTKQVITKQDYWGLGKGQDKNFKFCKIEACTWQSFGHRPNDKTPHAFAAMQLLEKMATDPGIVAIMKERELVVGTLGEMDPIDDRVMQQHEQQNNNPQQSVCLLGYNTNAGTRIDVKLRTNDLSSFRPYPELVSTLIHELSHNWVGEHNLLFWTSYGQMKAEYLYTHAQLQSTIIQGTTTAFIAGLDPKIRLESVYSYIMLELQSEMAQHGLHPNMIAGPIQQRCKELKEQYDKGHVLGGGEDNHRNNQQQDETTLNDNHNHNHSNTHQNHSSSRPMSAREKALQAAERRARENQQQQQQNKNKPN